MGRRRGNTKAQKDKFIFEFLSDGDPARAYRDSGLAADPAKRKTNGLESQKKKPTRDRISGQTLLKDPYVEAKIAKITQRQIDTLADEADATRHEIMSGYRNVYKLATSSGESRELNAAVRSLDGMARMMGYLIEHKIIHHERSDKQIEKMSTSNELNMFIKSIAIELGPSTMRLLTGETQSGGNGEIIDVGSSSSTDRGATEAGEAASSDPT